MVAHVGTPGRKSAVGWKRLDSINYEFSPRLKLLLCWLARSKNLGFLFPFGANPGKAKYSLFRELLGYVRKTQCTPDLKLLFDPFLFNYDFYFT